MDNFWLYIIIFGAIISFVQKMGKQNAPQDDSEPQIPTEEDIKRQLRELLGDNPAQQKQGSEQPKSTATHPTASTHSDVKPQSTATNAYPKRSITLPVEKVPIHTMPKVQKSASAKSLNSVSPTSLPKATPPEEPTSNIEAVLEDFTMEKAVIYAEILKPKYKEY